MHRQATSSFTTSAYQFGETRPAPHDRMIALGARGNTADLDARSILEIGEVVLSARGKIVVGRDPERRGIPARHALVYRFERTDLAHRGRHLGDFGLAETIADTHGNGVEGI